MSRQRPDRTPIVVPLLGLVFLVFLLGTAVVEFRLPPYPQLLEPAYLALQARLERARLADANPAMLRNQMHWRRARAADRGVTRYLPEQSAGGYTLYTSTHASAAWLLGPRGDTLHHWSLPFHQAFPDPSHIDRPVDEERIWWSHAVLLPDGSLVAIYTARGDTPYGYGMVKVDRESNLVWRLAEHVHHDLQLLDDGTFLSLVHDFRDADSEGSFRAVPENGRVLDDAVVRVSSDGRVLERVDLLGAFARTDFRWVLHSSYLSDAALPRWDVFHANAVRPVDSAFAAHHDFLEPGMVLLSLRSPSLLAALDMGSGEIVWMERSFWRFQHDPVPLDDGTVLLFDNEGLEAEAEGRSRALRLNPGTGEVVWSYRGTPAEPLYSQFSSHLQMLSNGNVLVTSSNAGRIFEVTPEGEIVWEFWNPERTVEDGVEYIASVAQGRRYQPEALDFIEP